MMNRQQYACRLPRGLAVATQYAVRPWFPQSRAERADRKSSATCGSVPQALSSLSAKLSVKISVVKKNPKKWPHQAPGGEKSEAAVRVVVLTACESTAAPHIKGTARKGPLGEEGAKGSQHQPGSPHLPTSSLVLTLASELLILLSLCTPSVSQHMRAPL